MRFRVYLKKINEIIKKSSPSVMAGIFALMLMMPFAFAAGDIGTLLGYIFKGVSILPIALGGISLFTSAADFFAADADDAGAKNKAKKGIGGGVAALFAGIALFAASTNIAETIADLLNSYKITS